MEGLRRAYGIGEPVRRGMELKIAAAGEWRPAVLGRPAGVHADVLAGRDCEVEWEDVFMGTCLCFCSCLASWALHVYWRMERWAWW